jgi:hypothetical protein
MSISSDISEEEAIRMYLGVSQGNSPDHSCFRAALVDMRKVTGRNKNDGSKLPDSKHGNWLGALGYMALLDQIGTCLKPKETDESGNSIEKALRYFTDLGEKKIQALYALRCAFAHDYGLANPNKGNQDRQHIFTVCEGAHPRLVRFPTSPWEGNYQTVSRDNITVVNLEALGDLVESVCQKVCKQAKNDKLEIELSEGIDELFKRYFFKIR